MARRSLQASTVGIEKAKRAFQRREWTQEYLASQVGLETRQPIWKFFKGKPVERHIFLEICFQLGLNWEEIVELPTDSILPLTEHNWDNCWNIDALVKVGRSRRYDKIQAQCSTMRLLDIAQPIALEDIYVDVNVLSNITGQRWLDIFELQSLNLEAVNCCGNGLYLEPVPAMQVVAAYPKLMLLGKPGAGKTTFLQYIATQCNQGKFFPDRIPIFIRLKNFAEDAKETGNYCLLNYITQELSFCGAAAEQIQALLHSGRLLILLDGLDQIPENISSEILIKIRKLSEDYYKNQIIITSRIATQSYQFDTFTEIEIADFDCCQIESFVQKWFVNVGKAPEKGKVLATQFMQKLQLSENRQIRELAVTPLLLNLACCVFQADCDFPTRRAELYKQALNILLKRWDETRNIKRDEFNQHLSLPHKLKLLSKIAVNTFKQNRYFFAQSNVQHYIADYLRNLPTGETDAEELQLNSEVVLKSFAAHGLLVERAQGIYSFSHVAFQEYLTARNIVTNSQPQILAEKLSDLVSHLSEPRWWKVFLTTASMLSNADYLLQLMKQQTDALVAFDEQLQQFLLWLKQKSLSVQVAYKGAAIRAFYLTQALPRSLTLERDLSLSFAIDPQLAGNLAPDLFIDLALSRVLSLSLNMPCNPTLKQFFALNFALLDRRILGYDPQLQNSLQQLKEQLPALDCPQKLQQWWNANGENWTNQLRSLMLEYRNIGHHWQLSKQQQELLQQYYAANQLVVECLNVSSEVTPNIRQKIEETLLLPSGASVATSKYQINSYVTTS